MYGAGSDQREYTEELVVGGVCCCCEDVEEREGVDSPDGCRGGLVVQSNATCWRCCRDTGGGGRGMSRWRVESTSWKWMFRWCGMMAMNAEQVTSDWDKITTNLHVGWRFIMRDSNTPKYSDSRRACAWGSASVLSSRGEGGSDEAREGCG